MSKSARKKKYIANNLYRHIGELLNRDKKRALVTKQPTISVCPYCLCSTPAGETPIHLDDCRCKGMS